MKTTGIVILIIMAVFTFLSFGNTIIYSDDFEYLTTGLLDTNWKTLGSVSDQPYLATDIVKSRDTSAKITYKYNGSAWSMLREQDAVRSSGMDISSGEEFQIWVYKTPKTAITSNQIFQCRLYDSASNSETSVTVFEFDTIPDNQWLLLSYPLSEFSAGTLSDVKRIAIRIKGIGSDETASRPLYFDQLEIGSIAPEFYPSFSANDKNGSTTFVSNLGDSYAFGNNSVITLRIDTREVLSANMISADFSELDSNFDSSKIVIKTNLFKNQYINGKYDIIYTISSSNTNQGAEKNVKIIAQDKFGNKSTNCSFYASVFVSVPSTIHLIAPAENETIHTFFPDFIYQSDKDAVRYRIQIASNLNFSAILKNATNFSTNYFLNEVVFKKSTRYYWRVQGINPLGEGEWSVTNSFFVSSQLDMCFPHSIQYFSSNLIILPDKSMLIFPYGSYADSEKVSLQIGLSSSDNDYSMEIRIMPSNLLFDKNFKILFYIDRDNLPAGITLQNLQIEYKNGTSLVRVESSITNINGVFYLMGEFASSGIFSVSEKKPISRLSDVCVSSKIFSPNGDGVNDRLDFSFKTDKNLSNIHIIIFDINGNIIYKTTGEHPYWTGESLTGLLPDGVYFYKIDDGVNSFADSFIIINK